MVPKSIELLYKESKHLNPLLFYTNGYSNIWCLHRLQLTSGWSQRACSYYTLIFYTSGYSNIWCLHRLQLMSGWSQRACSHYTLTPLSAPAAHFMKSPNYSRDLPSVPWLVLKEQGNEGWTHLVWQQNTRGRNIKQGGVIQRKWLFMSSLHPLPFPQVPFPPNLKTGLSNSEV